jgi:hypothetical protein
LFETKARPEQIQKLQELGSYLKQQQQHDTPNDCWPAGWIYLKKNAFTPENCADPLLMSKMAERLASKILGYVEIVEGWLKDHIS